MSRHTGRTINARAIRTEGDTGTSLCQLYSSILIFSLLSLVCLVEPQSPEKPTQSTPSPSALHEGSDSADMSPFDTYRKLVAERMRVAEIRRRDAEDLIHSVGLTRLFPHKTYSRFGQRRPLCFQPPSLYSPGYPSQDSNRIRARLRRIISQERLKSSPMPAGCRSISLTYHPILPNSLRRHQLFGSTHSGL